VNLMRAKTASFLFLAVTGGERMNFATLLVRELKSHMAHSTDTDHTDPGRWRDVMEFQRGKDSDPTLNLFWCWLPAGSPVVSFTT
jgi:hypothetical protein